MFMLLAANPSLFIERCPYRSNEFRGTSICLLTIVVLVPVEQMIDISFGACFAASARHSVLSISRAIKVLFKEFARSVEDHANLYGKSDKLERALEYRVSDGF